MLERTEQEEGKYAVSQAELRVQTGVNFRPLQEGCLLFYMIEESTEGMRADEKHEWG